MDTIRNHVIATVDGYLAGSGMSARRFGIQAVGSEHFLRHLKVGTSIRLATVERALAWIEAQPQGETDSE